MCILWKTPKVAKTAVRIEIKIDITEKTKGIPDLNTRINIIITTNKEIVEIIVISLDAEFELS